MAVHSIRDVFVADEAGDAGFTDDFLNMMGGGGSQTGLPPAYLKFSGPMREAFTVLTNSMISKGDDKLTTYGKFSQTFKEGSDELKQATSFDATEYNGTIAKQLHNDLFATVKPNTTKNLEQSMNDMVDICSNYLAQYAEYNKEKGPAFQLLIKSMIKKGNENLYQKKKAKRTYTNAATELDRSKGLETDHDDPDLTQAIHSTLSNLMATITPSELKNDMTETLDICSQYLSQCAIDEIERGPAFDLLINELEKHGTEPFTPEYDPLSEKFAAAYVLKTAPGLCSSTPNPATAVVLKEALHKGVDIFTPKNLKSDMEEVIDRCGNYLSAFVRDRGRAMEILVKMMKGNEKKVLAERNDYAMDYAAGAHEIETSPNVIPLLPVKDVADEINTKLSQDMAANTPSELKIPMQSLVRDVGKYLSQSVALKSGVAGARYPLKLLIAFMKSLGSKVLYKFKSLGQTYGDASEELKYTVTLEHNPNSSELQHNISSELTQNVPKKLHLKTAEELKPTITDVSKHLAKIGSEKGEALDYVVKLMRDQGDAPLAQLQGYKQTYNDGARRIENSKSLHNDKVDKDAYHTVKDNLTNMTNLKPAPEHDRVLPGIIEDSSKFLAAPFPESEHEKRRVLADLLAVKKDSIIGQKGVYKISYKEGGEELLHAPVGVTTAPNDTKKADMLKKINSVIPDNKKLQAALQNPANEGAAHLTDIVDGRGDAMQYIHDKLLQEKSKDFLSVGKCQMTHQQAAEKLASASHFGDQRPFPKLLEKTSQRLHDLAGGDVKKRHVKGGLSSQDFAGATDDLEFRKQKSKQNEELITSNKQTRGLSSQDFAGATDDLEFGKQKSKGDEELITSNNQTRETELERTAALEILHAQLKARGGETFYKQPFNELSHAQASEWLIKAPTKVDKSVKESADAGRLYNKFERKLNTLVSKNTPNHIIDSMQDVVIESSRMLSEYFVASSYKLLARDVLISEMQKRGNEILVEVDGDVESFFFSAQRLKKAKSMEVQEPCSNVAHNITMKLDEMIKSRSMARKLTPTMKEHIKTAADFLSESVNKPDQYIEAYVSLLEEMEATGNTPLIEGNIPKSYKDASTYLRQLTSFEDQIKRPNSSLQSSTETKLKSVMDNGTPRSYTTSALEGVIENCAKLLVSYVMFQDERTQVLKIIVSQMEHASDNVLLRHGTIRKTYADAAKMLQGLNTDQLISSNVDPVAARKIQIKLHNLILGKIPEQYKELVDNVIEDTAMHLALHLLRPQHIQVCKCMKNVFVQCELWCDEILRRVSRPSCTCSRHHSNSPKGYGTEISFTQCPWKVPLASTSKGGNPPVCSSDRCPKSCKNVTSTTYQLHSIQNQHFPFGKLINSCSQQAPSFEADNTICESHEPCNPSPESSLHSMFFNKSADLTSSTSLENNTKEQQGTDEVSEESGDLFYTPPNSLIEPVCERVKTLWESPKKTLEKKSSRDSLMRLSPLLANYLVTSSTSIHDKSGFSSRTPIVTTDQMSDWHAMMVSSMWNIQAWREWIEKCIKSAISHSFEPHVSPEEYKATWTTLYGKVTTEALQWRQYYNFCAQLAKRLSSRYNDKEIVSPTRTTVKTDMYRRWHGEMLDIIYMLYKWTRWLSTLVKETNDIFETDMPLHAMRWNHYKSKVEEYLNDWYHYTAYLEQNWEYKYQNLISDSAGVPIWQQTGPVWVVSAYGAVPSGAVAAGVCEGEVIWVARTTHKSRVLPAALRPSKHCCLVYADRTMYYYSKYQVMCNAEVTWVAWRAGRVGARAVKVAPGVYVGRVQYRGSHLLGTVHAPTYHCQVVIFERPFAFNCYELLALKADPLGFHPLG